VKEIKNNNIAILICYYGKLPWYFSFFVHSCKFNPSISFFIFSDIHFADELPGNVTIISLSLPDLKELASVKLGFEVNIDFPYKLCDLKPAYGLVFSEYITGYDFWGQSDIDIIYGNLRGFLTDEFLNRYDFISLRHDYTTGCFALYRNNELMNNMFRRSKDCRKVFSGSIHFCFDECNFAWDELTAGKSIFDLDTEIESFTHIIKSAERNGEIRCHFDFILMEGVPGRIRFDHGRIIYKNVFEGVLYHLYWLKRIYSPTTVPARIPDSYLISPTRIYFKSLSQ
jgi:hypothetical protein